MTTQEFLRQLNSLQEQRRYRDELTLGVKLSSSKDMHALMLLDKILPGSEQMLASADHDRVYLGVNVDQLALKITETQVDELAVCGVWYDPGCSSLYLFV